MGDFDQAFVHTLAIQSWSLYSVGMFMILLRIYARIHRLGIKHLEIDDYVMIIAGCFYTILVVCLNVIAGGGGSNLYPPEDFVTFTPANIQERIHGSKIVVVSEQAMLNVIYCIKACMLIMYTRLTLGLQAQRLVVYLSIYVFMGWVGTQIAFFTACRPFYGYWAMPPPSSQCATLEYYAIVQGCFNISSDSLMLLIPLPLITRLNVPWRHKVVLLVIFGLGAFVIVAAILTKVFNLGNIWDPGYMLWYTRESSVAIYVSNIPFIWPLVKDKVPGMKRFTPGYRSTGSQRAYTLGDRSIGHKGRGVRINDRDSERDAAVTTIIRGAEEPSKSDISLTKLENHGREQVLKIEPRENFKGGITMSTTVTMQVSEEQTGKPVAGLHPGGINDTTAFQSASGGDRDCPSFSDVEIGEAGKRGQGTFHWGFPKER